MHQGYLMLGGTELANNTRTQRYAEAGLAPITTEVLRRAAPEALRRALGHAAYRTPDVDDAAWFDPAEVESAGFAGLYVKAIDGIDNAQVQRAYVEGIGDGGLPGPERFKPRTIVVTGLLISSSGCSLEFGIQWLASALRGSLCSDGLGDSLCYLRSLPDVYDTDTAAEVEEITGPHWRQLRNVVCTASPTIGRRFGQSDCDCHGSSCAEVTFTLTSNPFAFRDPVLVADEVRWPAVARTTPDPVCPQAPDLIVDPTVPVPYLPTLPPTPMPAYPGSYLHQAISIPSALVPEWTELVPVVTIYSGALPLRNVRVRFATNPLELDPDDPSLLCALCTEVRVSYVPARTILTLDGTSGQATAELPGGELVDARKLVRSGTGGPWSLPVLDCATPYACLVDAAADGDHTDATIALNVVGREV